MITFGIITNSKHHSNDNIYRLNEIIDSIEIQNIPEYEIILVGDNVVTEDLVRKNVLAVTFEEEHKANWITRKKNLITELARYDTIVYQHDYIVYEPNWYQGWEHYGFNYWDLAMNVMINKDGTRFRDWCVFEYDGNMGANGVWIQNTPKHPPYTISPYIPSYNYKNTRKMYISGSFWIAHKNVMQEEPLDESFVWGQPEDIEWSKRVLSSGKYRYVMNQNSAVRLLHQKDNVWKPLEPYHTTKEYIDDTYGYYWKCQSYVSR